MLISACSEIKTQLSVMTIKCVNNNTIEKISWPGLIRKIMHWAIEMHKRQLINKVEDCAS